MNIFDVNATGVVGFSVTAGTASMQENEGETERSSLIPRRPQPSCIPRAAGLPVICEGLVTLEFVGEYSVVLCLFFFTLPLSFSVFYPIKIHISHIPFVVTCKKARWRCFSYETFLVKNKYVRKLIILLAIWFSNSQKYRV